MSTETDFKALGLQPDASWDEVKAAFRRLARTYHPDVAGPDGKRKFVEITDAYMAIKESISPGSGGGGVSASRASASAAASQTTAVHEEEPEVVSVKRKSSFIRSLFRKIFSIFAFGAKKSAPTVETESEYEFEIPPARLRFIGSIITKAESDIHELMARRGELKSKVETDAMLSRVSSRHPGVVLLALKRINLRDASEDLRNGMLAHFRKMMPTSEVLESLMSLFSGTQYAEDLAAVLCGHTKNMAESDAVMVLKWYKRHKVPKECMTAMLSHPSSKVVAAALSSWPAGLELSDIPDVAALLRDADDEVLIPLLRLLKKEKLSPAINAMIVKLSAEHEVQAVRVWASAIVRERNLS